MRQNFGKIYVAPEFTEEDLVPVEMPDLDASDFSGSDDEEAGVEEGDGDEEDGAGEEDAAGEDDGADVEPTVEKAEESKPTAADPSKAKGQKSSREVIRDLDEKISKYKQFLERAKNKRFSAIRSVTPKPHHLSFVYCLIS